MAAINPSVFIPPLPDRPLEKAPPEKRPNFVKRWCLGIGAELFIDLPFTLLIGSLATKAGLIPMSTNSLASSLKPLDAPSLLLKLDSQQMGTAEYELWKKELEEIHREYTRNLQQTHQQILEIFAISTAPIAEELLFRGLIQDVLLKQLPKKILQRIAPEKTWILDCRAAQVARIVLASTLFSLYHLTNRGVFSDDYVKRQVVLSFPAGLVLGAIKESKLGLTGAIAAHMTKNALAVLVGRMFLNRAL